MIPGDLRFWLALNASNCFNTNNLLLLTKHFSCLEDIFSASLSTLYDAGLTNQQVQIIRNFDFSTVEQDLLWSKQNGQQIITVADDNYPMMLREITNPPMLLYLSGNMTLLDSPQIAMVGSRKPTPIGKENAYYFAKELAHLGFTITSGLALGIDTASHQGALQTGSSIAVLGNGLAHIYPRSNKKLYQQLHEQGLIISEFPLNTMPKKFHFPRRNRIISGLSLGTLVIEAALQSGSLITARLANEQGREVFALPGSIHNPLAKGCHQLLRQGAVLTESIMDILNEFSGYLDTQTKKPPLQLSQQKVSKGCSNNELLLNSVQEKLDFADLDEDHSRLLLSIGYEPTPVEVIIARSGFTAEKVSVMLLDIEMKDLIQFSDGGYCRTK